MDKILKIIAASAAVIAVQFTASAQKYSDGIIDKTVAVVGNEMISISQLEEEVQVMRAQGMASDRNIRCELLEQMMTAKLFLIQARLDSLTVNNDMVEAELRNRVDNIRTQLGGDENVEQYFGKPLYKLRQEWRQTLQDQSLTQQMQQNVASSAPEMTPFDVQEYVEATDSLDLPIVPVNYERGEVLGSCEDLFSGPRQRKARRRAGHGFKVCFLACFLRCRDGSQARHRVPDSGDSGWLSYHRGAREKRGHVQCPPYPDEAGVYG